MKWQKLGLVFCPRNNHSWMKSHASNPVAQVISGDLVRVYFSTRDAARRSSIGYVDLDMRSPLRVRKIADKPVLSPGEAGLFDDSGVSLSCFVTGQGPARLYYMGWNLGVTVPWRNSLGLAVYDKKKNVFKKYSPAPILDRSRWDPYTLSYGFVLREGPRWKMWYGSNLSWGKNERDMAHVIKLAESTDGIHWRTSGRVAVGFKNNREYALARPFVLKEKGLYKMWYSVRGASYRIGYAESKDGVRWKRKDHLAGIDVSNSGWDSEMIEYPFVFDHRGSRYLLYNGNGYGKTGFGIARMIF